MAGAQLAILTGINVRNHPRGSEKQSSNTVDDRGVLARKTTRPTPSLTDCVSSW
jgi:hypothetical protein